jgi:hypothetical protein
VKKGSRKKVKKNVQSGIAHVHSTFNNTMITITDVAGNALCWTTAGSQKLLQEGDGTRRSPGLGLRQGARFRARVGSARNPGGGNQGHDDS